MCDLLLMLNRWYEEEDEEEVSISPHRTLSSRASIPKVNHRQEYYV